MGVPQVESVVKLLADHALVPDVHWVRTRQSYTVVALNPVRFTLVLVVALAAVVQDVSLLSLY